MRCEKKMCRSSRFHLILGAAALLAAAGLAHAQKPRPGGPKIQLIAVYAGTEPLPKPDRTVIYTFVVPADLITPNQPAAPVYQRAALASEPSNDSSSSDGEKLAAAVQASFSKALVDDLQKAQIFAEPAAPGDVAPPRALVVRGGFAPVAQRKSRRQLMGLGRGAGDVQVEASVSLLTNTKPILLSEFYLQFASGNKIKSAAAQTSAAADGAGKNAGEPSDAVQADVARIAKALAAQVEQIVAAQQWLAPPQTASK